MAERTVVRGALWANDLSRVTRPESACGDYASLEVHAPGHLAVQLAQAMATEEAVVAARLGRGCRAFAVWNSRTAEIASWVWVSVGAEWVLPLSHTFRFAPDECYGWSAGTRPAHRGRGLLSALLRCVGWRMAQEGARWMWNGVMDGNLPAQRAHAAAGYRSVLHHDAYVDPAPTTMEVRPVEYADSRLVARARRVVGQA